ncbi:MAG: homogentisate 1,2-dioxygenase [Chrysiogenetes bacterium]|nr:homogentisate 1,2-dioxygenase [Chrysiogenetes bacterium]
MKSFVHFSKGRVPRQAHVDIPEGLKDDELGRKGFYGRVAQLYRRNDPTQYRATSDLKLWDFSSRRMSPADESDPAGAPLKVLYNEDCAMFVSKRKAAMPHFVRNADADEAHFVHVGTGTFETEFGPVPYEPGDYVVIPKATTYRVVPDSEENHFFILETYGEMEVPDFGVFGRHAPFDPTLVYVPEPQVLESEGQSEWEVRVKFGGEWHSIFYKWNPCDVEGWKGDLFPFKLNIRDINVINSDTIHLPPTVHLFLQAPGLMVVNFLPRRAEEKKGAERPPWYHRNVDYDEVVFMHGGSFLGGPIPKGRITLSPQGIHHGIPEPIRVMARNTHDKIQRIEWELVAVDTERPLKVTPEARATDRDIVAAEGK